MNRSVRNGLAIAGMAGGVFFLGQAMAQAGEGDVVQDNSAPIAQQAQGSGDNDATVDQSNDLYANANANAGSAGVGVDILNAVGGNTVSGGTTDSYSTASNDKKEQPKPTTTTVRVAFDTNINNNVAIDSTVVGSGNATVASPKITQTNSAPVSQKSEGNDWDGKKGPGKSDLKSHNGGSGDNEADIEQDNDADINLGANAGDVGVGVGIHNAVGGNTVNCWGAEHSQVVCDVSFNTTINNNVDIHSIICGSGNATIGTLPSYVCNMGPSAAAPAAPVGHEDMKQGVHPAAAPAAKPGAKPGAKALSHAQPAGSLAFTGADVGLPLTLGLVALGLGGGLTLAGRRRQTATV